ncbi:hypothetical protein DFP72DRAFT_860312 [Ephemerocybe angulata]|uniref:Uncharacterized protein n=1 Tax=Ephemerocybe angulata TaxID=980116 RepID=A0A8H6LVE7_9AGAR|nr:hypothetical protein DFP72DRAFT_860312 [Tulosesus angulatus]
MASLTRTSKACQLMGASSQRRLASVNCEAQQDAEETSPLVHRFESSVVNPEFSASHASEDTPGAIHISYSDSTECKLSAAEEGKILFEHIQYLLEDFGIEHEEVLVMLKWTESIISGSFVLAILYPGMFCLGNIDVYAAEAFSPLVKAFLKRMGYGKLHIVYSWPTSGSSTISNILEFRSDKGQKINLILSASAPVLPLMQFHSTIIQNYIAFHGVVILHQQTLARIGLINLPTRSLQKFFVAWPSTSSGVSRYGTTSWLTISVMSTLAVPTDNTKSI